MQQCRVHESSSIFLSQQHQSAEESNSKETSGPTEDMSGPQPPCGPSTNTTALPQNPPGPGGSSQPAGTPFPLPIPPFPPVSSHLLRGTIPIPPPGWIPPPGHHIPIPPPTFIRPPPPLMVPPPLHRFPFPMMPPPPLDANSQSLPFPPPPWPSPLKFNPFVPPPNVPVVREQHHQVTLEKVLQVIVDDLKVIVKKDITRRMIEGTAFKLFEDWWEGQEMKTKVRRQT